MLQKIIINWMVHLSENYLTKTSSPNQNSHSKSSRSIHIHRNTFHILKHPYTQTIQILKFKSASILKINSFK